MSLNQSMSISTSSMRNYQYALSIVAHNIANLNTPGYYRQRADFQESRYHYDNSIYGIIKGLNGATIASITNFMDEGALRDVINSQSDASYYNTLNDALSGLEDIADALGDNGLNSILNDFFASVANLEQFPDDVTIRQQYIQSAQDVCDKFNDISNKLDVKKSDMLEEAEFNVESINSLLSQIADANKAYLDSGGSSGALSDIYSLVEELSQYADVTTDTNSNGTINVYIGGVKAVQGAGLNYTLQATTDPTSDTPIQLSFKSTMSDAVLDKGITEAFSKGKLSAQLEFLNGTNNSYYNYSDIQELLDNAANKFASAINDIQTFGKEDDAKVFAAYIVSDGNGNNQLAKVTQDMYDELVMFNTKDGSGTINAKNIQVNQSIVDNPNYVAAARIDLAKYTDENGVVSEDWKNAVGNSDNATELSDVQNRKLLTYGGIDTTLSKYLASVAGKVGQDTAGMGNKADLYQDIADQAQNNYANLIGVNLDEELADMIKYQRAYEASARVFTTVNSMFDTILSMV